MGTQFVVSLRDRWRDMYSERGLLAPYLLPGAGGANAYTPLASHIFRDDLTPLIGCVSLARLSSLTAWFSYHVVLFRLYTCSTGQPRRTAIPLFTNHNVTACQSIRGHQERTQNACQQTLYNKIHFLNYQIL